MPYMYNVSQKDYFCVLNMLDAIEKIKKFSSPFETADDFFENAQAFDASLMNFIVIAEMVDKISDQLKNDTSTQINWLKIKDFRNILAHNYFGVDAEEVWQIINNSLPILENKLKTIINQ